jgi:serine/threonine protein kinase
MNPREFKERYLFDPQRDLIAEGTYSRVFHATDTLLQRDICIKLFRKELVAGSPLIRELSRAGVFFHPNVCAFYDLVEIEETNVIGEIEIQPIGIVEYMNGGMITDYVAKHEPDPVHLQKLIKDILKGLSYLHSIGRPHLDLKPGNLLIKLTATEPMAKITDFLNSENLHTRSVPVAIDPQQLCYRAPECFENSYGEQGLRADIWSLGVMVYELVSGRKLFWTEGDTVEKVIRNVCYTDYWSAVHELPEPYITFVKKCLVRNVEDRNVSLEELTLILDGYKTEEPKSVVPPVVAAAAPIVETVVVKPVKVPEVPIAIATIKKETPAPEEVIVPPLTEDEAAAQGNKRSGGLSVLIVLGSLLILSGISAFIWKIIDDRHYPSQTVKNTSSVIVKTDTVRLATRIDTSGIRAEVSAKVVHDTVKLIQIQQRPVAATFTAPVKTANLEEGVQVNNMDIKVKVMPSLPYFDYLWVDKPYYFDLKTPLMSDDEYELYSETAAITALGKNTFYVKPTQSGAMDVMVLDKESHAKIVEKVYAVREKSRPIATIGDDITGGFVSPKMLLAKLTMQAKTDNGNLKIRSFHMTCNSGACDIQDVSDNGKFNESMIKFLRNVRPGEKLYFDNIIAEDESGKPIKLDPFQITTY